MIELRDYQIRTLDLVWDGDGINDNAAAAHVIFIPDS